MALILLYFIEFVYAVQGHSRLPILYFGTNRNLIYDFLLVINTNVPSILHRFRDIA